MKENETHVVYIKYSIKLAGVKYIHWTSKFNVISRFFQVKPLLFTSKFICDLYTSIKWSIYWVTTTYVDNMRILDHF